jgi:hypothetical protein
MRTAATGNLTMRSSGGRVVRSISRPFVWAGDVTDALPTPGGRTGAPFVSVAALNNRGQIVGSDGSHFLLWTH